MRSLMLLALSIIVVHGFSQTNTFPSSGNVGIGTTAPASKLHIVDGAGGEQLRFSRGTGTVRFAQAIDYDNL